MGLDRDRSVRRRGFRALIPEEQWLALVRPPTTTHADPGSLATDWIVRRCEDITRGALLTDCESVRTRLASELGAHCPEPTRQLLVWADDIRLEVAEADVAPVRHWVELRRRQEQWEWEREEERSHRKYLGDDVLKDTSSAVVWWLARNPAQVEETVRLIGALARLAAVAQQGDGVLPEWDDMTFGTWNEPSAVDHVAAFADAVFTPEAPERALFGNYLGRLLERGNDPGLAARVRAILGGPDLNVDPRSGADGDQPPPDPSDPSTA